MSNWKSLIALSLVVPPLAACGVEPECPAGSEKHSGVCTRGDDSPAQASDAGSAPDASDSADADAGVDGGAECAPGTLVYFDVDEDGVGAGEGVEGCPGYRYVTASGDCSPGNADVYPGNLELCNGADDNCDGNIDEGIAVRFYPDADGDGHGDATDRGELVCVGQSVEGKVANSDDCDDHCDTCTPDNDIETACDGKDDDCNLQIDDGVLTPYVLDCDGDHYLVETGLQMQLACSAPAAPEDCAGGAWGLPGDMAAGLDCNDREARTYPGATEACDGFDNDCDTEKDEGLATALYYPDCDGDGYTRNGSAQLVCGAAVVVNPICDVPYRWGPQFLIFADCADDDARAHLNASPVADMDGIDGAHLEPNANRQDFDCDGTVEIAFEVPRCTGSACDCWLDAPTCGQSARRKERYLDPVTNVFFCRVVNEPVACR